MSGSAGKKTSVTQADLRKLMSGQIGKSSATAGGSNSKRYKVGGRELALMEEQKRIKQVGVHLARPNNKQYFLKVVYMVCRNMKML